MPSALGWLFSASLLGIFVRRIPGNLPGDRFGRVKTLTGATAIPSLFSVRMPHAPGYGWLLAIRIATGLGLGAAVPNMIAIVSGSASERWRQPLTTMLWAAMPIGGITRMASAARRDQLSESKVIDLFDPFACSSGASHDDLDSVT